MKQYLKSWNSYVNKIKLTESHKQKRQALQEKYDVLSEISRESADAMGWRDAQFKKIPHQKS